MGVLTSNRSAGLLLRGTLWFSIASASRIRSRLRCDVLRDVKVVFHRDVPVLLAFRAPVQSFSQLCLQLFKMTGIVVVG
jgi:hypothetical protein